MPTCWGEEEVEGREGESEGEGCPGYWLLLLHYARPHEIFVAMTCGGELAQMDVLGNATYGRNGHADSGGGGKEAKVGMDGHEMVGDGKGRWCCQSWKGQVGWSGMRRAGAIVRNGKDKWCSHGWMNKIGGGRKTKGRGGEIR